MGGGQGAEGVEWVYIVSLRGREMCVGLLAHE